MYLCSIKLPSNCLPAAEIAGFPSHSGLRLVELDRESVRVRQDEFVMLFDDNFVRDSGFSSVLEKVLDNSFPKDPLRTLVLVLAAYNHLLSLNSP
jgi:hypothetical protein